MEHRWRLFENRAVKSVFDPKRAKLKGGWRKLQIEELREFCFSLNIFGL
jgi:hypothetical protein